MVNIDLKTLDILQALVEERSVSRTAARIGLSQPATSAVLAKLRDLFDDPILIRVGSESVPTEFAISVAESMTPAVAAIRALVANPPTFNPQNSHVSIRISATDYAIAAVLPGALKILAREAPGMRLDIAPAVARDPIDLLSQHATDLVIGIVEAGSPAIQSVCLFNERLVAVVADKHPLAAKKKLSKKDWLSYQRLETSLGQRQENVLVRALRASDMPPDPAHTFASFTAMPYLIRDSDYIGVVPLRLAKEFSSTHGLSILELPFAVDLRPVYAAWHSRSQNNPALMWLIECIRNVTQDYADASV